MWVLVIFQVTIGIGDRQRREGEGALSLPLVCVFISLLFPLPCFLFSFLPICTDLTIHSLLRGVFYLVSVCLSMRVVPRSFFVFD